MSDPVMLDPHLRTVGLGEVDDLAPLPRRFENRFVIANHALGSLVGELAGTHRVMEVEGSTRNQVHNVYLDTDDLVLYRAHLRRARRWKLRVRTYCSSGLSRAELKVRDARGRTTKVYGDLGTDVSPDRSRKLALQSLDRRMHPIAEELEPSMIVSYVRTTFVDPVHRERLTVDSSVQFLSPDGTPVGALLSGWSLLETKSRSPRARVTATLRSRGARSLRATKYTAAVALAGRARPVPEASQDLRRFFSRAGRPAQNTPGSA